jgi:hypothetical protein
MMQDGVKVLNSLNKLSGTVILSLDEIYSVKDDIHDSVFDTTLKKSLDLKGMLNPILVCSDFDFKQTDIRNFERRPVKENIEQKYRCLIGNNRYAYAVNNGYTHIECFVVSTFEQAKKAHLTTAIEPRKMLR